MSPDNGPKSADLPLYTRHAREYARKSAAGLYNAAYERPALLSLLPDVRGKAVLDLGCGAGPLGIELERRGARVTGLDRSAELLALARRELSAGARLIQHDFAAPLPLADGCCDGVTASLCLHYLRDWGPTMAELFRVLRPGGFVALSTHHPMDTFHHHPDDSYFAHREIHEQWKVPGVKEGLVAVRFWHQSLEGLFTVFRDSGFQVDRLHEPLPLDVGEHIDPEGVRRLRRMPSFILFRLIKPA
ncbi:MAG: methyltransferase domain-containing protein [Alphaproteobacteria bacterium]|nr:methyltransferase domain-containing protein [Alphaproteobacteria bacterium]